MGSEEGADLLFTYSLADRLGKTAAEIAALSVSEREGWIAYIGHLNRTAKAKGR